MVTKHILETIFVGSILPVITFFPGENDSLQSVYFASLYFNTCAMYGHSVNNK